MVARAFAVKTGLRYGRIITLVTSRSRRVLPAMNAMSASCSSASPCPGNRPSAVYGYLDSTFVGKTTWSAIIADEKPSASPRATSVSIASGVAVLPRVGT
jgi:hypothetical protein